jgi:hypothetical protein
VSIPFYITDPLEESPRVTLDIDVAIEVYSAREYRDIIEMRLRERGFQHDVSPGAPICRWRWDEFIVDIMPVDESILGFANPWYQAELAHTMPIIVSSRCEWRVLSAPFALAAKLAAFWSRGAEDPSNSHDLEDLLTLVNGRPELVLEVGSASAECHDYVAKSCTRLLTEKHFREVLEHHLPFGLAGQQRFPIVLERLQRLSRATQTA